MRLCSLLMLACFVSQTSCVQPMGNCSLMGCGDGLTVQLEPPLVEEGSYEIVVDLPEEKFRCIATLPPPEKILPCSSDKGDGYLSELHLDYSQQGELLGFAIRIAPGSVDLAVHRDEVQIASETVQPKYEKYQPNGAACDGDFHCRNATVVLHVR